MKYQLNQAIEILSYTPKSLSALLGGLGSYWTEPNEGPNTWSPFDVMGHLIHGEKTDWIDRIEITLGLRDTNTFTPFDRFAQEKDSKGKSMADLLKEFEDRRTENIYKLKSYNISEEDLDKTAQHPSLGEVSLRNLLSTWVAHDLNHIAQIARVMAYQYKEEAGPWNAYLRILQ